MSVQIEAFSNGVLAGYHHQHFTFTGPREDGQWVELLRRVTAEVGDFLRCDFRIDDQPHGTCQLVEPSWQVDGPITPRQNPVILIVLRGKVMFVLHDAALHPGDWLYVPAGRQCTLMAAVSGQKPAASYGWCELSR